MPLKASWTHGSCDPCFFRMNPEKPFAFRVKPDEEPYTCCFCGAKIEGIYVRHAPEDPILLCKGQHDDA